MIYVFRYLLTMLYTAVAGLVFIPVALLDPSGRGPLAVARAWQRAICWTCGISIEVEGQANVAPDCSYVLMTNHQSATDVLGLVATLPGHDWRFVAKRELTWIPIFGQALLAHRHVIVDRSRHERAVRSLRAAAERIRGGTSVVIFPEGTRSPDGVMRAFKSGGFHLAIQAGAPILPVSISGSQRIAPRDCLRIESGRIRVTYGEPIPTAGLAENDRETLDALKARVREAIERGFDRGLQGPGSSLALPMPLEARESDRS